MLVGNYYTWVEKNLAKCFPILNLVLYNLRAEFQSCQVPGERRESHSCKVF